MRERITIVRVCSLFVVASLTAAASATPLTGSGPNLPIPAPNPGDPPRQGAALANITPTDFDGTWTAPALSPWVGTFYAKGPVPSGLSNPVGITRYDFTTLTAGLLPAGTFFAFGDVDGGSATNETFLLQAFDASSALITTPWLDEPLGVTGSGTGGGGAILPGNMPGWEWDASLGRYTIDGSTVTGGNPSITVFLESNADMAYLVVERTSGFANFGLSAPIPEPASLSMLAVGAVVLLRRKRRR